MEVRDHQIRIPAQHRHDGIPAVRRWVGTIRAQDSTVIFEVKAVRDEHRCDIGIVHNQTAVEGVVEKLWKNGCRCCGVRIGIHKAFRLPVDPAPLVVVVMGECVKAHRGPRDLGRSGAAAGSTDAQSEH